LIVKRGHEPRKGEWSLPGGRVELGESLLEAVRREIKEETGLEVDVGPLLEAFDRVHRVGDRVRYHFVILDYLCTCTGGTLCPGDDADDARWVAASELEAYGVNDFAAAVIRKGLANFEL
jgi:8-oxo-dGTP diphosphatase